MATALNRAEKQVIKAAIALHRSFGADSYIETHGKGTIAGLLRAVNALKKAQKKAKA